MPFELDRQRLVETMKTQAKIGGTERGGLHRLALSDEDKEIRDWFVAQMEDEGLETRIDEFGNMFGRREGRDTDAEPVLVGSHLDSQPYGGIYDGALGVVAALELVREFNERNITTERPVEIVNWTNEEGSRFQPAMQGSGVWAGAHDIEEEYAKTDEDGNTFEDELERIGYKGTEPAKPRGTYDSSLELHIEQGPYLEETGHDVGVVTGVVGFIWGATTYYGEADHSGSTPMHYRQDAMVAASDVITQVRRIPSTVGDRTVGTVGFVDVKPNSINIIPSEVTFTWGFRDPERDVLDEAHSRILHEIEAAAAREGVDWDWDQRMDVDPVHFADRCTNAVEDAANGLGYDPMRIFSGAGHDATHVNAVCDTAMVFAVSENGKSHNESEYTSWDDCYKASNTLASAVLHLAGRAN